MCSAGRSIDFGADACADSAAGAVNKVAINVGTMVRIFFQHTEIARGRSVPRLPEEIGLSITICSPIIRKARCLGRETTTWTLSGVASLSNDWLILTGSCLRMRSDAFRIV